MASPIPERSPRRHLLLHPRRLRGMVNQETGSIVNISSIHGMIVAPGLAQCCAAKAGILGLMRTAAREVAQEGVRVKAVAPGFVYTPTCAESIEPARGGALKLQTPTAHRATIGNRRGRVLPRLPRSSQVKRSAPTADS
jgi:3-oxoacyl-[acyl-carrier protein] reductase